MGPEDMSAEGMAPRYKKVTQNTKQHTYTYKASLHMPQESRGGLCGAGRQMGGVGYGTVRTDGNFEGRQVSGSGKESKNIPDKGWV